MTTDQQRCPLCTEQYDDRTDLRVHLEVQHRKSEIVSSLLDLHGSSYFVPVEESGSVPGDREQPVPPA
ncbi:hypothetical protein [Natronobacterium texcoconense]|uniref:C2H2-type domain-containing protein n=1 Tax=Natronobacterium texcoconense TaxID=1095778 RepID=A0A1H1GCE5_NATTX|nr:hypothetical protein [Natronobacterium texcoconense]SDR10860.1 hypothetical protein SAMN04489842_2367 [Natronobacterium texcoconense]